MKIKFLYLRVQKEMSVQRLKWFILFIVVCVSIPAICQASVQDRQSDAPAHKASSLHNRSTHLLDSLVSLLHFTTSDQNEPASPLNTVKKAFAFLLFYLKDHAYLLQKSGYLRLNSRLPFDTPDQKAYYVYTLHKLLI